MLLNFISNSMKFTNKGGFIKITVKILEEQVIESQHDTSKDLKRVSTYKSIELSKIHQRKSSLQNIHCSPEFIDESTRVMKYIKLQLIIEDNGVGISKTNIKRLFNDYTRLEEHNSMNSNGTGLGLSICQKIINQMGGTIKLESEEGQGTKVIIEMSCKSAEVIEEETSFFKDGISKSHTFVDKNMKVHK